MDPIPHLNKIFQSDSLQPIFLFEKFAGDEAVKSQSAPPAPERPQRPPPPSLRRTSIDRAPHRPAPPVPIPGQTPVRRSLKRLPRQTSAPCGKCSLKHHTLLFYFHNVF